MKRYLIALALVTFLASDVRAQTDMTLSPRGSMGTMKVQSTGSATSSDDLHFSLPKGGANVLYNSYIGAPSANLNVAGAAIDGMRTLTITKFKLCKLVVLEDTADKIVIGCRAELSR